MAAFGLLGRNIMHRSQRFLGQCVAIGHHTGNTEVGNPDRAVFRHHNIMGFDIPVDQVTAMGVLQAFSDLGGKMQGFLPIEDALFLHILLQRNAIDQFHHNIIAYVGRGNIVNRYDIGMAQHTNRLSLRPEATTKIFILQIFIFQNFHSYQSIQSMAPRFIYNGHTAGTDHFQKLVPIIQQFADITIHIHCLSPYDPQTCTSTQVTLSGAPRCFAISSNRRQQSCLSP